MRYIGIIALILVLLFSFYTYNEFQNLKKEIDELKSCFTEIKHELEAIQLPKEIVEEEKNGEVLVYFVHSTPTDFLLVPVTRKVSKKDATPLQALNLLIQGPLPEEDLHSSLPPETKVLSLKIKDKLATANFSKELSSEFVGGSQLESHLVNAILFTLTQFEEIERVQILLEGEKIESLGGHINIDHPLP